MTRYVVTFDRVGRNHHVPPAEIEADTDEAFADALLDIARRHCGSRELDVTWSFEEGRGCFIAGVAHSAGHFTITQPTA